MSTPLHDEGRLIHLDEDICLELVAGRHVGRIAIDDQDGPVVFPVNYTLDAGTVVFRTGAGSKLTATRDGATVAFQVDEVDVAQRAGWSVLVRGQLEEVTDDNELARLARLPLEPFAGGTRDHFVRIATPTVSGRRIVVPKSVPDEWLAPEFVPDWSLDTPFRSSGDYSWDRPGWV